MFVLGHGQDGLIRGIYACRAYCGDRARKLTLGIGALSSAIVAFTFWTANRVAYSRRNTRKLIKPIKLIHGNRHFK